ncbi:MAG: carboxypeptidase-like regulatory domain-containing protein, partial [Bacteroidota bacterium]
MNKSLLLVFTLFLSLSLFNSYAQELTVTGRVTSASDNSALPGVNVTLRGTNRGTITDIDGNFRLAGDASDTLIFSFIGFNPLEVPINGQSSLDINLQEDVQELSEVVVTGFQEIERKLFTGSAERIEMADIRA